MVAGYTFGFDVPVYGNPSYAPEGSLSIRFTDLATNRQVTIAANDATLPAIEFDVDGWEATAGQMYLLEIVGRTDDGGLTVLKFYPYEYDTTAKDYDISTTAADGVHVKFVKVFSQGGAVQTTDAGWITLR